MQTDEYPDLQKGWARKTHHPTPQKMGGKVQDQCSPLRKKKRWTIVDQQQRNDPIVRGTRNLREKRERRGKTVRNQRLQLKRKGSTTKDLVGCHSENGCWPCNHQQYDSVCNTCVAGIFVQPLLPHSVHSDTVHLCGHLSQRAKVAGVQGWQVGYYLANMMLSDHKTWYGNINVP